MEPHFANGATYESLAGSTSTRLAALALSHLPLSTYKSTSHILDSACGPGIVTKLLLSPSPPDIAAVPGLPVCPAPRVTGIDLSPPMIDRFRANATSLGWGTAEAHVQDSGDLRNFPDGAFDAVVMNMGIFMLADAGAAVAEMYRVLRPGGSVVVTSWKTRRPQEVFQGVVDTIRPGSGQRVMEVDAKWGRSETLGELMRTGGFKGDMVQVHEASPDLVAGSGEALVEVLSAPFWTEKMREGWKAEEKARWGCEVKRQLSEEEKRTGSLVMAAWVCVARKEG